MRRGAEVDSVRARLARALSPPSRIRVEPGRGPLLAMGCVALVVALLVGGWLMASRPAPIPMSASNRLDPSEAASIAPGSSLQSRANSPGSAASGGSAGSAGSGVATGSGGATASGVAAGLVVDVVGKVRRPGVYRLPAGARVNDAVGQAGGLLPGVDPITVNLARRLSDGEQVAIGVTPPAGAAATAPDQAGTSSTQGASGDGTSGSGTAGGSMSGTPVDLNSATADQLDALPGVGPVLAQRIVDWRTQHGRFGSVDQLHDVSGIGEAKFADLRALVTVG